MCIEQNSDRLKPEAEQSACTGRKKIWQLESAFHCSVIGTCMTVEELKQLCKKMNLQMEMQPSDYELHHSFVGIAGKQGYAARRLQKYLDLKYKAAIHRFAKLKSDRELLSLWSQAIESGDVAGAFWALTTHPSVSKQLLDQVYGEVHMLSHLAGQSIRVDRREIKQLQQQLKAITGQLAAAESKMKSRIAQRDATIGRMTERLAQAKTVVRELDIARDRLAVLDKEPHAVQLQHQFEQVSSALTTERARAERAETLAEEWKLLALDSGDRHLRLESKLAQLETEHRTLETTLEKLLAPDCTGCTNQDDCRAVGNLCGRCILYVGGRSRQYAHFRALVERQNGCFMHHDGGLHDGRLRLSSILPQADAVFCALDCVSHDAAKRVKRFCKHNGKKMVLLPRSSLAAFTQGLSEVVI